MKESKTYRPPAFAKFLLGLFIRNESRSYAVGDFIEVYNEVCSQYGKFNGYIWFWYQTIKSFFPFIFHSFYWGVVMFRNYFKVTVRGFLRNKAYTFINVLGLAVGLACCILIMLWVQNELSYESFVENKENVYRVVNEVEFAGQTSKLARTPAPLANAMKNEFPEITAATSFWPINYSLTLDENEFNDKGALVDQDFFKMFSLKIIQGNPDALLNGPLDVVLSESMSKKIFADENPVGKTLNFGEELVMNVTGVFKDFPENSHLQFQALSSMEFFYHLGFPRELWPNFNNSIYTYVEVDPNADIIQTNAKVEGTITRHADNVKSKLVLQPLNDVHLYSDFTGDVSGHGNIEYVYVSVIMGVFLLLIACFNFMNLSTAKAAGRAKEIGVRKVIGAFRKDLIGQFLGEAFILTTVSFLIGLLLVYFMLPEFNILTGKFLKLNFLENSLLLWGSIGILFVTGIFAGGYPAFLLSSFQPTAVLKGPSKSKISGSTFRKVLVVVQFSLSIAITIGMMVIYTQIDFMRSTWLGFDREHLLYFKVSDNMVGNLDAFKTELKKYTEVVNTSVASHLLTDVTHVMGNVEWEGKDPSAEFNMNCLIVDERFVSTLGMKIKEGSDFTGKPIEEGVRSIIVNETALRKMNLKDPLGKSVKWGDHGGTIVGVVEDFHFKPLQNEVEPMILIKSGDEPLVMYIKIRPVNIQETLEKIGSTWSALFPDNDYNPRFVDEAIDEMYDNEKRVESMFEYFTVLTLIISCLGLFGLASYMAEKRTKEIGIRKALGASVPNVILMLSKEFTFWIVAANIIAWPAAYFFMENWLQGFAYRTELNISIFLLAGLGALVITWITVAFQTIKAALANPVKALKYE